MNLPFPRQAKVALGAAVAAFVLGGAGVALAAAEGPSTTSGTSHHVASKPAGSTSTSTTTTGNSTNAFGQQVKAQVATCKAARPASGDHQGIGECVSDWVKLHNPSNSNGHGASSNGAEDARTGG